MFGRTEASEGRAGNSSSSGNNTVTWVNDWYVPTSDNSASVGGATNNNVNFKLKGWHKERQYDAASTPRKFDSGDILNLDTWKYYKEVPILKHTPDDDQEYSGKEEEKKWGALGSDNEVAKKDLGTALSVNNKDEMGTLSGIVDS
ncbi:Piso0_005089 [Millerozyma farinosa CBS 7064]|uniref:Piso0_005089 protein n=1 Tax=Pichia sorbitophila (strain ATCC MYA-4447 / BCRC 22081 / CBS 7064 / NBRC 10061 / NRRL Y-12695) TaxID=559304 RepID=G8Y189_PICSO|nr:Piso0_005089 [Millerozyma farinosa CBS 7064]